MLPVTLTAAAGSLQIDFDTLQPLPVGSTWMVNFHVELAANSVTVANTTAYAADLAVYNMLKTSAGADTHLQNCSAATLSYDMTAFFRVTAASTNQSILLTLLAFTAASSGYATLTVTPVTSGLAETRMRGRYPGLFELQDKLEAKYGMGVSLPGEEVPRGKFLDNERMCRKFGIRSGIVEERVEELRKYTELEEKIVLSDDDILRKCGISIVPAETVMTTAERRARLIEELIELEAEANQRHRDDASTDSTVVIAAPRGPVL
jgi:hypothetical protein